MYSSWLTSRLGQWLRDRFPGVRYFGVWEYQKRGALHLHVCVRVTNLQEARLLRSLWKTRWIALLDYIGNKTKIDIFERKISGSWRDQRWRTRVDIQVVEKSVARYLSKYCSKSKDKLRRKAAYAPASWWFASQNLRDESKSLRIDYSAENLTLSDANTLFDRIGGFLASVGTSAYPLFNRFDHRQRGLICLGPPAVAGACTRAMKDLFSLLNPDLKYLANETLATVSRTKVIFDGLFLLPG
jgi:hypothetical protein